MNLLHRRCALLPALAACAAAAPALATDDEPAPVAGACCLADESCAMMLPSACAAAGGLYAEGGRSCAATRCLARDFQVEPDEQPTYLAFPLMDGPGQLTGVVTGVHAAMSAHIEVENLDPIPQSLVSWMVVPGSHAQIGLPSGALVADVAGFDDVPPPGLAPSDGQNASGPDYHDFGIVEAPAFARTVRTDPTTLAIFAGSGEIALPVSADGSFNVHMINSCWWSVTDDAVHGTAMIAYLVEAEVPCPADVNGDLLVNVSDLVAVIVDWGTNGSANGGDVNGDGMVDTTDLVEVIVGWGMCS